GRGGIGVVRFSGTEARTIAAPMLRLKHDLAPGYAIFGELIDPSGSDIPVPGTDHVGTGGPAEPALSDRAERASRMGPAERSSATRIDKTSDGLPGSTRAGAPA